MNLHWESIAAAVTVLVMLSGAHVAILRFMIRSALNDFEIRLIERLNSRYIRSDIAVGRYAEIERRLGAVEERM